MEVLRQRGPPRGGRRMEGEAGETHHVPQGRDSVRASLAVAEKETTWDRRGGSSTTTRLLSPRGARAIVVTAPTCWVSSRGWTPGVLPSPWHGPHGEGPWQHPRGQPPVVGAPVKVSEAVTDDLKRGFCRVPRSFLAPGHAAPLPGCWGQGGDTRSEPSDTSSRTSAHFPQLLPDSIRYSNVLHYRPSAGGPVARTRPFSLPVDCYYPR